MHELDYIISTNAIIHETHSSTPLNPFVFLYVFNSFVIPFKCVTKPGTICDTLLFQVVTKKPTVLLREAYMPRLR